MRRKINLKIPFEVSLEILPPISEKATALYSLLHFFVDAVCALAMFGWLLEGNRGYQDLLLYNFSAFALQMPVGVLLDILLSKDRENTGGAQRRIPFLCALSGVLLTIFGTSVHPVLAGIGNALFHVGGGVCVITEDFACRKRGAALGVFVAPGALGLYIGAWIAKNGTGFLELACLIIFSFAMLLLLGVIYWIFRSGDKNRNAKSEKMTNTRVDVLKETSDGKNCVMEEITDIKGCVLDKMADPEGRLTDGKTVVMALCCFLVVIIRSYVGMAVNFTWKTEAVWGTIAVLAVVFGKMAGGILAAKYHLKKVIVWSLVLASCGYLFSNSVFFGVAALFFFNMTMPITLYQLVCRMPELPGFSFGLLTFALFLGFLPVYFGINPIVSGSVIGAVGSALSLLLLWTAIRFGGGRTGWK